MPQTTARMVKAATDRPKNSPAPVAQMPLVSMAATAIRALPTRSAHSPAAADPIAPHAMAIKAIADALVGRNATLRFDARLATAKAAIQVQTAYSSHMCPRYPSVASLVGRWEKTRAIARGSNGALAAT